MKKNTHPNQVKCTFTVLGVNGNPQTVTETITNG